MNSYKFLFVVGLLNLGIPFFGIPSTYKYAIFVAIGVVTVGYALFVRAIIKEQEAGLVSEKRTQEQPSVDTFSAEPRTIEEVIEMSEETKPVRKPRTSRVVVSDIKPRKVRKPKVKVTEEVYE